MARTLLSQLHMRRLYQVLPLGLLLFLLLRWWQQHQDPSVQAKLAGHRSDLVSVYIEHGTGGSGGRWYIPPSWLENISEEQEALYSNRKPLKPKAAAELALELAIRGSHFIENTNIPRIIHQKWNDFNCDSWSQLLRDSVSGWLEVSLPGSEEIGTDHDMAYILWDNEGMNDMIQVYEPQFAPTFHKLPLLVEKADAFRIAALKWYGGIYADIDTVVLEHPSKWVHDADLEPWENSETGDQYSSGRPQQETFIAPSTSLEDYQWILARYHSSNEPVSAIVGIEADNPPDTDAYWRMGYGYPIQITNWAMAMAPQHPIAISYLQQLEQDILQNSTILPKIDPVRLSGPQAFTKIIKEHAEQADSTLDFDALTGLHDPPGGRGKIVAGDVLVLPITGFSPGRGWVGNMGSQSIEHPNARLYHAASSSWRKFSLRVHAGKLCRKLLGLCRNWSNVP